MSTKLCVAALLCLFGCLGVVEAHGARPGCARKQARLWQCVMPAKAAAAPGKMMRWGLYTLVVYSPPWCAPCRVMKARYPGLLRAFPNLAIVHLQTPRDPAPMTAAMMAVSFPKARYPRVGFPIYFLMDPFGLLRYKGFGVKQHLKALTKLLRARPIHVPVPQARAPASKKASKPKALAWYRSGWFWFGMVSAAAAIATTAALVVSLQQLEEQKLALNKTHK